MPTKRTPKKPTPRDRSLRELGEAQERATLRRAREHQRRVTMLSRSLRRAVDAAQVWKLRAARTLVEGTDYVVVGADEVDRLTRRIDELNEAVDAERDRVDALTRAPELAAAK